MKRTDITNLLREEMSEGADEIEALNRLETRDDVDEVALAKWVESFNNWRASR